MENTATIDTPATALLNWSSALAVGDDRMDDTHEEFVAMLNQLLTTPTDKQLPLYRQFVEHTVEHFAQEERWMIATGFSADNCHASHHATILETMHAVVDHYEKDDKEIITRLAEALAEWFPQHAASMDAGLALHLKQVGFDSRTETMADPSTVRPASMSGCGSVTCS
ncbi:MAG: hemerythrin domain-containing protein [Hydrogenophaga sp.]|uniref:bacteriohemerythrin n=1 Tax=Hydrogenophaga sp. TaxID=1904254 RepID=UPI002ABBCE75|nr:hemerythrin domain-containing protein [Hydrogenophaga sp.]MDZ4190042.1 hemerythrin domain-containing protein [Hydrogenophaga sp.]